MAFFDLGLGDLFKVGGDMLIERSRAKTAKAELEEKKRQANLEMGFNYAGLGQKDAQFGQDSNLTRSKYLDERATTAADLRKRMNLAPLADRASAMLAARAGAAPAAFQARDYTRGTTPGAGAAMGGMADGLNAQRAAAQRYQLGEGGMMNNPELQAALDRLTSMAGVPEEYKAKDPARMRLEAALASAQQDLATSKLVRNREAARRSIAAIQQQLAQLGG